MDGEEGKRWRVGFGGAGEFENVGGKAMHWEGILCMCFID